ncbi:MAG: hypothetical protein LBB88_10730 [Planctomycetaceae bacterium]|jgi:hypothetical protein|nr:hypothetical protein [Planctomycetaceae bacterium]
MGENSSEFLPIAILGNRYAVLIKIEFLEIPYCRIHFIVAFGNISELINFIVGYFRRKVANLRSPA